MTYPFRYTRAGYIFLGPEDDCVAAARGLDEAGYSEEFCLARDFDPAFAARLCAAGFLVMSERIPGRDGFYVLLPKHHLVRSCLFFPDLHVKRSVRPHLPRYELRFDTDFDLIVDSCIETHGPAWLTPPLVDCFRAMRGGASLPARPVSFGLYRAGRLVAGEFGVIAGCGAHCGAICGAICGAHRGSCSEANRVYTSYSGFHHESSAGTVQMILTAQYLCAAGFSFWDLGMPLDYKRALGAREISRAEFLEAFFGETDSAVDRWEDIQHTYMKRSLWQ